MKWLYKLLWRIMVKRTPSPGHIEFLGLGKIESLNTEQDGEVLVIRIRYH